MSKLNPYSKLYDRKFFYLKIMKIELPPEPKKKKDVNHDE